MIGDSLEEPYLLGQYLSLIAWGRMAGQTSSHLEPSARMAKMFLTFLGGPEEAVNTLGQFMEMASGKPTISGSELLRGLTLFRIKMMDRINPHLSGDQFAAIRLGFNNGVALALSNMAIHSPEELKSPLLQILEDLVADARILGFRQSEVDEIVSRARRAAEARDLVVLHSQIKRLNDEAPPDLRSRKLSDVVFELKAGTSLSPGIAKEMYGADTASIEKLLAVIPDNYEKPQVGGWSPVFCPKGTQVAYRAIENGEMFVVVGDRCGPGFASVGEYLALSPDGQTVAYVAETFVGETFLIHGSDRFGPPDYDSVWQPTFSRQGGRFAFVAGRSKEEFVVIDGESGPAFENVGLLTFSDDGRQFAYRAEKGLKQFIVVNGQQGPEFDAVSFPAFSPDGSKVAYGALSGERYFIILDGKPVKEVPAEKQDEQLLVTMGDPVFTANGSKVAYWVHSGDKQRVLVGEDSGEEYDCIIHVVGAATDHIAYVGMKGNKLFLVRDGLQSREIYPGLSEMVFSPDGKALAMVEGSVLSGIWHVVVNGTTGPAFEHIEQLTFSRDGKTIGYGVREGRELWWKILKVDGK